MYWRMSKIGHVVILVHGDLWFPACYDFHIMDEYRSKKELELNQSYSYGSFQNQV